MIERSYGRILWRSNRLGLLMVNPRRQSFFIYAEPLLALILHPREYAQVKKRDRKPARAVAHHAGDIWAKIVHRPPESVITLYFGPPEQRMEYNPENKTPTNFVDAQEYTFPQTEWETFGQCLRTMIEQQRDFDRLQFEADTLTG
jgi:hypothetical protein